MARAKRRSRAALGLALLVAACTTDATKVPNRGRRASEQNRGYYPCPKERWSLTEESEQYYRTGEDIQKEQQGTRTTRNLMETDWTGNVTQTVLDMLASTKEIEGEAVELLLQDFSVLQQNDLAFNPQQYWDEHVMPMLVESVGRDGIPEMDQSYYYYYEGYDDEGWIMQFFNEGIAKLDDDWKDVESDMYTHGRTALESEDVQQISASDFFEKMRAACEGVRNDWHNGMFEIGQDSPIFFNSVPGRDLEENEWTKVIGSAAADDNSWLSETKATLLDYLLPYQTEANAWFSDPLMDGWMKDPLAPLLDYTMQLVPENIMRNNNSIHAHDLLPDGTGLDWYVLLPEDPVERQEAVQEIAKELPAVLENMGMKYGSTGLSAESLEAAGDKFLSMLQLLDTPGASKYETATSSVNRNRRLLGEGTGSSSLRLDSISDLKEALSGLLEKIKSGEIPMLSIPEGGEAGIGEPEASETGHDSRRLLGADEVEVNRLTHFLDTFLSRFDDVSEDAEGLLQELTESLAPLAEELEESLSYVGLGDFSHGSRRLLGRDFKIYHALIGAAKALQPLDEAGLLSSDTMVKMASTFFNSLDLGLTKEVEGELSESPISELEDELESENLMRRLLESGKGSTLSDDEEFPSISDLLNDVLATFQDVLGEASALLESIAAPLAPVAEDIDDFMEDLREDLINSGARRLLDTSGLDVSLLQNTLAQIEEAKTGIVEKLKSPETSKRLYEELRNGNKDELLRIVSLVSDPLSGMATFIQQYQKLLVPDAEAPQEDEVASVEQEASLGGRRALLDLGDLLVSANLLDKAMKGDLPFDGSFLDEVGKMTDLPIDGSIIKQLEQSGIVTPQQLQEGVHEIEELISSAARPQDLPLGSEASANSLVVEEEVDVVPESEVMPPSEESEDSQPQKPLEQDPAINQILDMISNFEKSSVEADPPVGFKTASLPGTASLLDRIITALGMDRVKDFVQGCRSLRLSCAPQLTRIETEIEQYNDVLNPVLRTYETWTFLRSQAQALAEKLNEDGLIPNPEQLTNMAGNFQDPNARSAAVLSTPLGQALRERFAKWQETFETILKSRAGDPKPILDLANGFKSAQPDGNDVSKIHSAEGGNSSSIETVLQVMGSLSEAQKKVQKWSQAPTFFVNGALSDKDEKALHRIAPWLKGPDWVTHTKILERANSFGYFFGFLDGYKVRDNPVVAAIVLGKKIHAHLKAGLDTSSDETFDIDRMTAWDGLLQLSLAAEDIANKYFGPLEEPPEWIKVLGRPTWQTNEELKKLVESNAYLQGWAEGFMFRDDPAVDLVVTAIKIAKRHAFVYNEESWDKDIRIDFGKIKFGRHSAGIAEIPSAAEMLDALKFRLEQRPLLKRPGVIFPSDLTEPIDMSPEAQQA